MQKHKNYHPNCPFVRGQMIGINFLPPEFDEDHPTIRLMQRVNEVVKKVNCCFSTCCFGQLTHSFIHVTMS